MTGNKNAWRAPLAGLASVAMIATMGVTALSANAFPASVTTTQPGLTFANNGSQIGSMTAISGMTIADAAGKANTSNGVLGWTTYDANVSGDVFTGWYNGSVVANPAKDVVTSNTALTAGYAPRASVVEVNFKGVDANVSNADGVANFMFYNKTVTPASGMAATEYVPVNQGGITAAYVPQDLPDGLIVAQWLVEKYENGAKTGEQVVDDLTKVQFTGKTDRIDVSPKTTYDSTTGDTRVTTWTYKAPTSFADSALTGAYSDGDSNADYTVDALGTATAPQVLYGPATISASTQVPDTVYDWTKSGTMMTPLTKASVLALFKSADGKYQARLVADGGTVDGSAINPNAGTNQKFTGWKLGDYAKPAGTSAVSTVNAVNGKDYVTDWGNLIFHAYSGDKTANHNFAEFSAASVLTNKIEVTFDYAYADAPAATVKDFEPTDVIAAPDKPTRDGYLFGGWALTRTNDPNAAVSFVNKLAGSLDGDVTYYAIWYRASQKDAKTAVDYVRPDKHASYFTKASFDTFKAVWKEADLEYKQAEWGAMNGELEAAEAQKIIDKLETAWKGLRFNTGDIDTTLDGVPSTKSGAEMVYRLATPDGARHFITGDEYEVLARTNTNVGQGGWKLEAASSFAMVNREFVTLGWASADPAGRADKGDSNFGLGYETDADNGGYTPTKLVDQIARLYNPTSKEHLYTTDGNEVKTLTESYGWSLDSQSSNLFTPRLYQTSNPVVRFYNKATGLHFYTADKNEIQHWTGTGVWDNEGNKFYAL